MKLNFQENQGPKSKDITEKSLRKFYPDASTSVETIDLLNTLFKMKN